ncbi:MAG: response regulator transcription factor [Tepidisphaeraceae bacterium]
MDAPVRVMIADDSNDVAEVVRMALDFETDLKFVGRAATADEVLPLVTEHRPDVLLLDLSLGTSNGMDLIGTLRSSSPETRILIFSGYDDPDRIDEARARGACGFVTKGADIDHMLKVIRESAR